MNDLMTTLYRIQDETGASRPGDNPDGKPDGDNSFNSMCNKLLDAIKEVRKSLKLRDELIGNSSKRTFEIVAITALVRQQINKLKQDYDQLEPLLVLEEKVAGNNAVELHETYSLIHENIKECERLERAVVGNDVIEDSSDEQNGQTVLTLPDVDDPQFIQLKRQDQKIDDGLQDISTSVKQLKQVAAGATHLRVVNSKQVAIDMGTAADVQNNMMTDIDKHVDKNTAQVQSLNKRLRKQLDAVAPTHRFLLYFICCCVLLALAGVLYRVISPYIT